MIKPVSPGVCLNVLDEEEGVMVKTVKVYSTHGCPWCIKVKQFLSDSAVPFENYDVATDQQKADEMVEKSGQMGVPVIDIDGEIVVGFDKERIKKALGLS